MIMKVALCVILALTASLLTTWKLLLPLLTLGLMLALAAGLTPWALLKRLAWLAYLGAGLLVTLPLTTPGTPAFALQLGGLTLSATREGLALAGMLCLRMLTCFLPALALMASTPLPELLGALGRLGVPRLFIALTGMAVRYISVLREEARRQAIGRRSRGYRPGRVLWDRRTLRTTAQMLGMLLLRAYDRSERVYWAMMSRGYSPDRGSAQAHPFTGGERWAAAGALLAGAALVVLDRTLLGGA